MNVAIYFQIGHWRRTLPCILYQNHIDKQYGASSTTLTKKEFLNNSIDSTTIIETNIKKKIYLIDIINDVGRPRKAR